MTNEWRPNEKNMLLKFMTGTERILKGEMGLLPIVT